MTSTLRVILGDQLSHSISSLKDICPEDVILICELHDETTYVKHHPKKIAFLFAAMRHFANELNEKNYVVRYVTLTDPMNTGSFTSEIQRTLIEKPFQKIIVTEPGEYRIKKMMETWEGIFQIPVEIREDNRFLCQISEFKKWSSNKKQLRMEYFYREMRKKYTILMEDNGNPVGGKWNYDKENRKPPKSGLQSPQRIKHKKTAVLLEVLSLVEEKFSHHFGKLLPFHYAITRKQALIELDDFIDNILANFGDYQDAMQEGQAYLNHSLLSSYINAGLLLPLEICKKAEAAYHSGKIPLNSAEGFIRQIIGWREYIRGIYWCFMPSYAEMNYLDARKNLPDFYWSGKTNMRCLSEVIAQTAEHAYSHHIQRLMITGNFALLAGIDVKQVQEWYLAVYSDAYEWVEMPNTLGMALYGDSGIVASKPYAASGHYINKMSNFCKNCFYDPNDLLGQKACPFNALYWNFMINHREKLQSNQRLPYVYSTLDKFSVEKKNAIIEKSRIIFETMENNGL